ncbi:MAG: radical SAM protein [Actinomycetia bacterium]|nr:radical SAM protein [Actinomycetes bacterium]
MDATTTTTACPRCGSAPQGSCAACRTGSGYQPVKDRWLEVRPALRQAAEPFDWAIGTEHGGLVAVWDWERGEFVPTGHDDRHARYLWLELTTRCPHRCRHCYLGDRLGGAVAAPEAVRVALRTAGRWDVAEVVLAGGEPTMHPAFVDLLAEARRAAPRVRVLTNGWTQRPEVVAALAQPGVSVEVPLLGWEADHDWMTRTPGSFVRVVRSLHLYRRAGVALTLTTTLTRRVRPALDRLRALAEELGVPFQPSVLSRQGEAARHWDELAWEA